MTKPTATKDKPRRNTRLRSAIVESMRDLHAIGAVSDEVLARTTQRMVGNDAAPVEDQPS